MAADKNHLIRSITEKAEEEELGEIGSPRESEHECAYDGLSFKGADLPERYGGLGVATGTAEECRLACVKQVTSNISLYSAVQNNGIKG